MTVVKCIEPKLLLCTSCEHLKDCEAPELVFSCEIELIYFKKSGKYYTEGRYNTHHRWMFDVSDEIKEMRKNKTLPGISGSDWIIFVDADKHPLGYPMLIL